MHDKAHENGKRKDSQLYLQARFFWKYIPLSFEGNPMMRATTKKKTQTVRMQLWMFERNDTGFVYPATFLPVRAVTISMNDGF